jgi:Icc-related predicted phosphoesterase
MKILAFADLHEDYGYAEELERKAKHADLIICAGDITVFGENMKEAFAFLDSLGKKVLIVHGNHESEHALKKFCEKSKNVVFLHKSIYETEDLVVFGYGGGGFSHVENGFHVVEKLFASLVRRKRHSVFVTHSPPYRTKLDELGKNYHVGNKTYREFIRKYQPSVAVSGHIHETFRAADRIGKTILVNPGPRGAMIHI